MSNTKTSLTPWLAFCKPRADAGVRLFCFPYAGGGATFYRNWSAELPPHVDVCPVQLPGRETRVQDPPYREIKPLVEQAATALLPFLGRPYCFLGYSMGALIAFELARHLNRQFGTRPKHLFVCAFGAPHLPHPSALRHDLPDDDFVRELAKLEGTPKEVFDSPELLDFLLPTLRADCRICDLYEFERDDKLPCPITAFGGADDPQADRTLLQGWRDMAQSGFNLRVFPGGHFFIQQSRREFMDALSTELERQPVEI